MLAQINVTPLVDVMLVLLILFMVITPTATRGIDVRIPDLASEGDDPKAKSRTAAWSRRSTLPAVPGPSASVSWG